MNLLKERMSSDRGASNTVETIIMIALSVFAGLALFTFILQPVRNSSDKMGQGIEGFMDNLMDSQGDGIPQFAPGTSTN